VRIAHIAGATRVLGRAQGYLGLAVRDAEVIDRATGKPVNQMTTAWEVLPHELLALSGGANVELSVFGNAHPPVLLSVGDVPVQNPQLTPREVIDLLLGVCRRGDFSGLPEAEQDEALRVRKVAEVFLCQR
jgi:hypothetical protein